MLALNSRVNRQLKREFKILLYLGYHITVVRQGVAMDAGYVTNKSF